MRAVPSHAHHGRTGGGGGPLRGRRTLSPIFQRVAELAFCRTKMGRGDGAAHIGCAAVHKNSGQSQGLRHSGAGAELPEQGDVRLPEAEGGGDILIEQIACKQEIDLGRRKARFVERTGKRFFLKGAFRLLPGFLTHSRVVEHGVENTSQRAFAFLFSHDGGVSQHRRAAGQHDGVLSFAFRHMSPLLKQRYDLQDQPIEDRGGDPVNQNRTGNGEHFCP